MKPVEIKSLLASNGKRKTKYCVNTLMRHYHHLAESKTNVFMTKAPPVVQYEEVLCAAIEGLWKAIQDYDPNRGATFETYADNTIRRSIINYLRSIDPVGRTGRAHLKKEDSATAKFYTKNGRDPSVGELAKSMKISVKKISRHRQMVLARSVRTFTDMESDDGVDTSSLLMISSQKRVETDFEDMIHSVSPENKVVFRLYYVHKMTMRDIAWALEVSEGRVSEILKKETEKMRRQLGVEPPQKKKRKKPCK